MSDTTTEPSGMTCIHGLPGEADCQDCNAVLAGGTLSFAALRALNVPRCINGFGHTLESWSVAEWMCAAMGELGEAANVAKKMLRHRDNVAGNTGDDRDLGALREKLARELADTILYIDLVAASQGIDLGLVVRDVFNRKSEQIGAKERL